MENTPTNTAPTQTPALKPSGLSPRIVGILFSLSLVGQIAWAVENSWFNTFVFDKLTPDPRPISWMVAVSAITATLTTIFMGTLSDRRRVRRPFILFGYIAWGLATILFPTVAYIKTASIAVFMVVLADAIMTFFGSTANDASFNAWATDISNTSNRGRVEGVINVSIYVANLIALGAAGYLIDTFGYFIFFYTLGGIVILVGLVAGLLLQDDPGLKTQERPEGLSYLQEVMVSFNARTVRENKDLFWLFLHIMLYNIGLQVSMPYMFIYIEHYLGITKSQISIIGGVVLVVSALVAIPLGRLADRFSRRLLILFAVIATTLFGVLVSFSVSMVLITITFTFYMSAQVAQSISSGAWMRDLFPEENRGRFLGLRMIFWVMIPMVTGPSIGSALIQRFGEPTILEGASGFIPHPIIWQVTAVVCILSVLPLLCKPTQHIVTSTGVSLDE